MKLAVRVVKAFPWVLKNAPVPAFDMAADSAEPANVAPSNPPVPPPEMVVVVRAPAICRTPSTTPS